jgi:dipeptide transport system ATP-binding protein
MSGLLDVAGLSVEFATARGVFRAVDDVSLRVDPGEVLCVVGESGSGKSVTMLATMGLIAAGGRVHAERMMFDGTDLQRLSSRAHRNILGRDMAMVFQEPMSSLNPCFPVGWQIAETLAAHKAAPRRERPARVIELLRQVGIPAPETRLRAFPHQLSGGMNQRVMIAMAIACNPRLLIADEPTTALDVTIQKQILDLMLSLQRARGMAMVLITHDLGVVAETADRVQVMYAGQTVEQGPAAAVLRAPRHPYTAALLAALPERAVGRARLPTIAGVVPGIDDRPGGCLFNPRCRFSTERCVAEQPALADGARCHYPLDAHGLPTNGHPAAAVAA